MLFRSTGSLVNPELLSYCKPTARIYNSASLDLGQIINLVKEAEAAGEMVARVHTGDPSLYGAIQEQMDALRETGIPCKVIPGVSSFLAAAAAIPHELTLPGVTQTVILTRLAGRTPVPQGENLAGLASHGATMCIFLSVHDIAKVAGELVAGGYVPETPVIVVEKASWPEERVIKGTLQDIAGRVAEAGVKKTALIMVGPAFGTSYQPSLLYDRKFSHGYRDSGQ